MVADWVGIVVSRDAVCVVHLRFDVTTQDTEAIRATVVDDRTTPLQDGDRGPAYRRMQEWLVSYLKERGVGHVVVKGSAVAKQTRPTLGLLEGAELRGVAMAAVAEAEAAGQVSKKAALSKTFGERKVDDYLRDDEWWDERFCGSLRKGSREAALVAYAAATGG